MTTSQTQLRQNIDTLRRKADRLQKTAKSQRVSQQDAQRFLQEAQEATALADKLAKDYDQSLEYKELFKRQADLHFGGKGKKRHA